VERPAAAVAPLPGVAGVLALALELAEGAAAFGDSAVDGGVAGAGDLHDLVVAIAKAHQVEGAAVVRLDRGEIREPLDMLDAVRDLVGNVPGVGWRIRYS
jgi:hypothetical protein